MVLRWRTRPRFLEQPCTAWIAVFYVPNLGYPNCVKKTLTFLQQMVLGIDAKLTMSTTIRIKVNGLNAAQHAIQNWPVTGTDQHPKNWTVYCLDIYCIAFNYYAIIFIVFISTERSSGSDLAITLSCVCVCHTFSLAGYLVNRKPDRIEILYVASESCVLDLNRFWAQKTIIELVKKSISCKLLF